jgi:CheY-like chemotaxis protein
MESKQLQRTPLDHLVASLMKAEDALNSEGSASPPHWRIRRVSDGDDRSLVLVFERDSRVELSGVVHDLRTPLAAIVGAAERLSDPELLPHERAKEARAIARVGRDLLGQVDGLLGADRAAEATAPSWWSPIETATEVVEMLDPTAREKDLDLVLVESGQVGMRLGDPGPFRRILVNLIGNAVKFGRRGRIEVTIADRAGELVASVQDEGPGIEPGLLPRLFSPGVRGESARASGIEGHGLGLANVRELAAAMGGTVKVESRPGEGSTFTVTVPPERRSGGLSGLRILLVDDGEDNRRLIHHHLRIAGADVLVAADGFGAESVARATRPDVILLDLAMPGRDGTETLASLRACGVTAPALALTASIDAATAKRAIQAGFHRVLTKPIDRESLAIAVREAISVRAAA